MKIIGAILVIIGTTGVWNGPADPEYVEDWIVWIFALILLFCGLWWLMH